MTNSKSLTRSMLAGVAFAALVALASPAGAQTGCGDTRDGQFFGYIPESSMLVVTCWPVILGPGTVVEDLDGNTVEISTLTQGEELKTWGCTRPDGFTLDATRVEVARNGSPRASDEQFTLIANGSASYRLSAASTPLIGTPGTTDNPTLGLEIGKRYRVDCPSAHPFSAISRAASFSGDVNLLMQGGSVGSFESNIDVAFQDFGEFLEFTLTPALADAMATSAAAGPGYRCDFHPSTMRAAFNFRPKPTALTWPSGGETFEFATLGSSVSPSLASWVIVTDAPAQYLTTISNVPASATNQAAGSTRWLRVNDSHDANSVQDRLYSGPVNVPGGESVLNYTWGAHVNVETTVAATQGRLIVQHRDTGDSQFKNVGGLEYTDTGVNVVIIGTSDGGVGIAGASVTTPLYSYGDAGGFAKGTWVPVSFTVDFSTNHIHGTATGTDGVTTKNAMAMGLALQGAINSGEFRFCIRNHGTGNTSVVSIDNLTFAGVAAPSAVESWEMYD